MSPRYVQHKSGQGETWKVLASYEHLWRCLDHQDKIHLTLQESSIWLPKSEYVLMPPSPIWTDVTAECTALGMQVYHHDIMVASLYRLRKVRVFAEEGQNLLDRWVFLVERLEEQP